MFSKFGGEEKCRLLVEKLHANLDENVEMCSFFEKQKQDAREDKILKEKMSQYLKYILGGSEFWLGRSMKDSHKHLKITENHFDNYYKAFTSTLRKIKTPVKIM